MKNTKQDEMILLVLALINMLLLVYVIFIEKDSVDMEIMKSGGTENFALTQQLYSNPQYVAQQKQSIQQGLDMFGIK